MSSNGNWHLIQIIVNFSATTYTAQVGYDGGVPKTLTSANNKTVENVKALWIHYSGTAVDYTMDVDDIEMTTSDTPPDFLGPAPEPSPPPGVVPFNESFEGGAVGTQPTSQNTSYDRAIGDKGDAMALSPPCLRRTEFEANA